MLEQNKMAERGTTQNNEYHLRALMRAHDDSQDSTAVLVLIQFLYYIKNR